MHAFLAYFDTFFTPSGAPAEGSVSLERFDETLKIDGRPGAKNDVSFTTGVSRPSRALIAVAASADYLPSFSLSPRACRPTGSRRSSSSRSRSRSQPVRNCVCARPASGHRLSADTRRPFDFFADSTIEGTFSLKKSKTNSRELDVEIHWQVLRDGASASDKPEVRVQVFKVR